MASFEWPPSGGGSGGVTSINTLTGAVTLAAGTNISITPSGNTLTIASSNPGGTVTSVGLSAPSSLLTVSGSPITSSGTLALALANQNANLVFAGPASGSATTPTFRSLVAADLPSGTGTVTSVGLSAPSFLTVSGSPVTSSGTLALSYSGTALPIANGGTGTTNGSITGSTALSFTAGGTDQNLNLAPSGNGSVIVNNTNTLTSGNGYGLQITPTYNQTSGSASNSDLYILRTQTAVGGGAQYLINAQVSGSSPKFTVDNTGVTTGLSFMASSLGSATNPAYTFTANPHTGFYGDGVGGIAFASGGSAIMNFQFTTLGVVIGTAYIGLRSAPTNGLLVEGSVGIGTAGTSVTNALQVVGTVAATTFSGSGASLTGIPLTTGVTGVLPIANGGTNNGSLAVTAGGVVYTDGSKLVNVGAGSSGNFLKSNGSSAPTWASAAPTYKAPTIQIFTSGSGTYTTPTSPAPLYIKVTAVGGGGGGAGASGGGGNGGNTTFSNWTAGGGAGSTAAALVNPSVGGAGGTPTTGTGIKLVSLAGAQGSSAVIIGFGNGGDGGVSPFGGAGTGGQNTASGTNAVTNSGSGGGGSGYDTSVSYNNGGGGAGAYQQFIISSLSSTYSYGVGAAGSAGTGAVTGGAGGSGYILVEEFYQ